MKIYCKEYIEYYNDCIEVIEVVVLKVDMKMFIIYKYCIFMIYIYLMCKILFRLVFF